MPNATATKRASCSTARRSSPCARPRSSAASAIWCRTPRVTRRSIAITGHRDHRYLTVTVDDDGPGIPLEMREDVFKPFLRLDDARNQDEGGTGLGLAIARDIARSHGGEITLGDSPLGGLRATCQSSGLSRFRLGRAFICRPAASARAAHHAFWNRAQVVDESGPARRAGQSAIERGHGAVETFLVVVDPYRSARAQTSARRPARARRRAGPRHRCRRPPASISASAPPRR